MSIERTIRTPPVIPTAVEIRALLREFGMKRWRAAQIMCVSESTMKKYLKSATSRYRLAIPLIRWRALEQEFGRLNALYGCGQRDGLPDAPPCEPRPLS